MTDHTTSPGRRLRIWGTAAALALGGIVALWSMVAGAPPATRPSTTSAVQAVADSAHRIPTSTPGPTSVNRTEQEETLLPTRTVAGGASQGTAETVTSVPPSRPATDEPTAGEPTTFATTAPTSEATTTPVATTTTPAADTLVETTIPLEEHDHHHDGPTPTGDDCHIHGHAVTPECHPEEFPTTTAPDPTAIGDCPGNFHQWFMVRDECVLEEVRKEFLIFDAGSHRQRMTAIRDGHLLAKVFTELEAFAEHYFGEEAANDPSVWSSVYMDADNRGTRRVELYGAQWFDRDRIDVRIRTVMADGSFAWAWNVVPFTYVDGQWKISYQGFCRFINASIKDTQDNGGTLNPCPPDPRPGIVELEHVYAAYDPIDDPTRTEVNLTPGW